MIWINISFIQTQNLNACEETSARQVSPPYGHHNNVESPHGHQLSLPHREFYIRNLVFLQSYRFVIGSAMVLIFSVIQLIFTLIGINVFNLRVHF